VTFVAGKNQITVFADGVYVGSSSQDVPEGEPMPGSRPRMVDDSPQWENHLRRLYDGATKLIA
ncbi:MAG TPA: hypothetical protein VFC93_17785, partial [Chloroflexota bacterium]|nr:hypothetical protein [Chloroflexota bacterium]